MFCPIFSAFPTGQYHGDPQMIFPAINTFDDSRQCCGDVNVLNHTHLVTSPPEVVVSPLLLAKSPKHHSFEHGTSQFHFKGVEAQTFVAELNQLSAGWFPVIPSNVKRIKRTHIDKRIRCRSKPGFLGRYFFDRGKGFLPVLWGHNKLDG